MPPTPVTIIIEDLLGTPIPTSDPRLMRLNAMEAEFDAVCKLNILDACADDVAEYVVDPDGRCRVDLDNRAFALHFAISDSHASVILDYVRAFFEFFQ